MKKYLTYISFCLIAAVSFTSCDTDDNGYREEPRQVGAFAYLSDRSITLLDQNADLSIDLHTNAGVTFESIELVQDGSTITTANISGDVATFNSSAFGDFLFGENLDKETGSFNFTLVSTLSNGEVLRENVSVNVGHALSLDEVESVRFRDPTSDEETILTYSVSTHSATIDDLTLEWKKNDAGTFTEDTSITIDPAGGEIDLAAIDYDYYDLNPGDTLYYRFTAQSGNLTDVAETQIAILPQDFEATSEQTLSGNGTASQVDLSTGDIFPEGHENGEIGFMDPAGFRVINDVDLEFVRILDNSETFYEEADLMDARAAFNSGLKQTFFTDVEFGDVFVYRITRDVEDEDGGITQITSYGILRVGDVTSGADISFDIAFAEGVILE